jgi:hypothetical protein
VLWVFAGGRGVLVLVSWFMCEQSRGQILTMAAPCDNSADSEKQHKTSIASLEGIEEKSEEHKLQPDANSQLPGRTAG